ncbi:MAG TPA: site-specific integrase [Candidatus Dormibacteraeota bacterium]|nr:site-specific integrase [Candidatus Dormibacteraeota bacterium]
MAKIIKRGSTYYIDYRSPATRMGKRKRVKVGPSKRDAEILLGQLQEQVARGMHPTLGTIKPMPFGEAAARFMVEYVKVTSRRPETYQVRLEPLSKHFGDLPIGSITRAEVNRYRTLRLQQPKLKRGAGTVSKSTVNREVAFLSRLFTWARDEAGIFAGDNPCRRLRFDEPEPDEDHYLTPEQADKLIAAAAPHAKPILGLMFEVCSRKTETLMLEWSDVDLTPGAERVTFKAESTKSGKARTVPLTPVAIAILRELGRVRFTSHNRVFTHRGRPITRIDSAWKTARKNAGLPSWVTPHTTRHTGATWFRQNNGDLFRLKDILGHSDIRLTERYAKASPDYQRESLAYMGRPKAQEESRGQGVDTNRGSDASNAAS